MKPKLGSGPARFAMALILFAQAGASVAQQGSQFPGPAGWTVEVDAARDMNEAINRLYRDHGAPVFVVGQFFDISRSGGSNPSYAERKALDERWAAAVARLISTREFRIAGDSD